MRKKNLKKLQLRKSSVSKLYGGSSAANPGNDNTDTGNSHYDEKTVWGDYGCPSYSELRTACYCYSIDAKDCHNDNLAPDTMQ
ncbi:hypothetical protein [Kordia sp.]|uniref:hypothetical protein n=1 Tax=Kordia sp. TaxID=1965332 RepID=UPI003D2BB0AA